MINKRQDIIPFWGEIDNNYFIEVLISVLNSTQEGILIADDKGWIKYINPAFTKITGVEKSDRVGKNILKVVPNGPLAKAIRTRQAILGEKLIMKETGIEIICNASPIRSRDNKMIGGVVVFQDISELQKLNLKLQESQEVIKVLNKQLATVVSAKHGFENIIGNSPQLLKSIQLAKKAAETESTVLLLGESGTGKELFAHAIHKNSLRKDKPFVKVNCASIPENLLESEFFGFEKGAFTGADRRKLGMFDLANKGTIFLDEIGDMNFSLQAKLLRVLEEGEMFRVGGTEVIKVDVRVIAATNLNLKEQVRQGKFRSDLYYRLNVLSIVIPPLRQRTEDILFLAKYFLEKENKKLAKGILGFTAGASRLLLAYDWPGNIRELRNCIERSAIMAEEDNITESELQFLLNANEQENNLEDLISLEEMEKKMIKHAIELYGNTLEGKKKAATVLKISLRTLYNKINKYEIE